MGIFGDYDVRLDPSEVEYGPEFPLDVSDDANDGTGRPRAVVQLSRSISDAAVTANHIVVAAGKLVFLEVPRA